MQLWRDTGAALARATGMLAARSQEPPRSGKSGLVTARPQFYAPYIVVPSPTVWPSGLRRWLQAPVRKGVGSNPTAVTCIVKPATAASSAHRTDASWRCRPCFPARHTFETRPIQRVCWHLAMRAAHNQAVAIRCFAPMRGAPGSERRGKAQCCVGGTGAILRCSSVCARSAP